MRHGKHALPSQVHAIQVWLKRTGRTEEAILEHYGLSRLDDLPVNVADHIITRLMELARVRVDGSGSPYSIFLKGQWHTVAEIQEVWRIDDE